MARFTIDVCVSQRSPGRMIRRLAKLTTGYVEARLAARFEALDLSFTQWIALKVMHDDVVSNAGELARELGITTGATTRLVDTLEAHGLIARDRGMADRRVVSLSLTPVGRETMLALQADVVSAWSDIFADIDQAEAEAFIATLGKLYARAERLSDAEEVLVP
jgi:DNA-binding MarR family transcriptional regulator